MMKNFSFILMSFTLITFACKKSTNSNSTTTEPLPDNTAPIITLKGLANYTFSLYGYVDPGVTAIDDKDGDISSKVEVSGIVTASIVGTYTLEYNVKDAAGNKAET